MNPARHPVLLFTMFCLCALLGMMVLRPDQNQRREAELSQMTPAAALADLGGYAPYGPTEQGIAALHARLALAAGDLDLARKLLGDLADQHPDNPAVRDFLAETETLAGGTSAAAGHLEVAYRLDPTQERRDRLGLLYRLLGERQKEADLLIGADVQTLTMADLERAVDLLLSEGRSDKAEQLYRGLIAGTTALAGPARQRLVMLLIDLGRDQDAFDLSVLWITQAPDDDELPAALIRSFVRQGSLEYALQIAERQLARDLAGLGQIVLIFAETGHGALARTVQAEWLARVSNLSENDWRALSMMAARTGDLSGLRYALSHPSSPSPEALAQSLLQFLRYYGSAALLPYRSYATADLAEANPLVGAAFALELSQPEAAARLLSIADTQDLSPWDRSVWQSLSDRLPQPGTPSD